jgi:hypothetical protein
MSYEKLISIIQQDTNLLDITSIVYKLKSIGALSDMSVRNCLIRYSFDEALKNNDYELIKNIFIDLSIEYDVSIRTVQRVVYDYMKK